jgi:hypothetical protein
LKIEARDREGHNNDAQERSHPIFDICQFHSVSS